MDKGTRILMAAAASLALALTGCGPVAASRGSSIPQQNVQQCIALCSSAGLELQSLVIVANQTGCVCAPPNGRASNGAVGATSGGAVAVLLAEQSQQNPR